LTGYIFTPITLRVSDHAPKVKRIIQILGKGEGYMLALVHIMPAGPAEKVLAMVDAALEFGSYKCFVFTGDRMQLRLITDKDFRTLRLTLGWLWGRTSWFISWSGLFGGSGLVIRSWLGLGLICSGYRCR